jgi:hypothetical protein
MSSPAATAEALDREAEKELADGKFEARAWLTAPDHAVFEYGNENARKLVEGLYARGARAVWVTGVETMGKSKVTASLVVELPADKDARGRVLALCREAVECGASDVGQKYVGLALD